MQPNETANAAGTTAGLRLAEGAPTVSDESSPTAQSFASASSTKAPMTLRVALFTSTMFLSAFLLFSVEPMVAKMVLPRLGGTPAVWNTCLVFFQAVLLGGYLYAHLSTDRMRQRPQIGLHLLVLLTALVVLPIHVPAGWAPPVQQNPALWLLALLSVSVGLPFFVLSATTPILQKWFFHSGDQAEKDPYFLYAASNAGSLAGLLSYPFLFEPTLNLSTQSRIWEYGYGLLFLLACLCAAIAWRAPQTVIESAHQPAEAEPAIDELAADARPAMKTRLRWVVLAFAPASLTLGVTTALTTDMPPIPLFWVLPLSLYLLSFVVVFARKPLVSFGALNRRLPFLLLLVTFSIVCQTRLPLLFVVPLDLLTLFCVAVLCHGELARSRPSAKHLTDFYLWMSVGGVLGGIFNALIAPVIFSSVIEFPLVLVLAALLRPPIGVKENTLRARRLDFLLPAALGLSLVCVISVVQRSDLQHGLAMGILVFGLSLVWCLSFGPRPIRFAAGLAAVFLASTMYMGSHGHVLHTERSFFGVYRVSEDEKSQFRTLTHSATVHGLQFLDPQKAREPLAYYSKIGPIGQVFDAFSGDANENQVAIVGLGAGSMTCYVTPPRQLTYYEIDPVVERIAGDPKYFTFLRDCNPQARVVLGDARMSLQTAPDHSYGMIIIDAFSGDSIPVHLLTREAFRLYLTKLTPGGILAFHLSNRYLDLLPVVGTLAGDAGLVGLVEKDTRLTEARVKSGSWGSIWAVVGRSSKDFGRLASDSRWTPLVGKPGSAVWTDDFSSVMSVFAWTDDLLNFKNMLLRSFRESPSGPKKP